MGNVISTKNYKALKTDQLKETGFANYTEVSSSFRGGNIELVTDESCGEASNLLKLEAADRKLNMDDFVDETDGWLTQRHEMIASVTIELCNDTKIAGLDIDTTGYIDSCPSFAAVEGYRANDMTWHVLLPEVRIKADTHNYFEIKNSDIFSNVKLTVAPGGGVARFRVYGDIVPDWSDKTKEVNLASANLGACIVRWTDDRIANKPNILLDNGRKMADGWLTPRSRLNKDRNEFTLIKLATPGILNSIIIDTTAFEKNAPQYIFVQGCYSKDVDPHYDSFASWICLIKQSPVLAGGCTTFEISVEDVISHIRLYIIPDGGIQQVKVFGVPADKKEQQQLLIEQGPQVKAIQNTAYDDPCDDADKSAVEELNLLNHLKEPTVEEYDTEIITTEIEVTCSTSQKRKSLSEDTPNKRRTSPRKQGSL